MYEDRRSPASCGPSRGGVGLAAGIPVAAGGGDNAAAAVGTGIIRERMLNSSIGTSGVLFAHDEFRPDPSGRVRLLPRCAGQVPPDMPRPPPEVRWPGGGASSAATDNTRRWRTRRARSSPAEGLLFRPISRASERLTSTRGQGPFFGLNEHPGAHDEGAWRASSSTSDCLRSCAGWGRRAGGASRAAATAIRSGDRCSRRSRRNGRAHPRRRGTGVRRSTARRGRSRFVSTVEEACEHVSLRDERTEPNDAAAAVYNEYYEAYRPLYPATADTMHRLAELSAGGDGT
ncbi:MAG: hypothetical protein WKH64_05930 [Chloroflexia bacterium]